MVSGLKLEEGKIRVACPSCEKINAVPADRVHEKPVCGVCQAMLSIDRPIELTDQTFEDLVNHAQLPVVVDFWACWCGPCQKMGPVLERFAQRKAGEVIVAKVDTDANPRTSSRFEIQGIPTLIVFRGGQEAKRQTGLVPERVLDSLVAC